MRYSDRETNADEAPWPGLNGFRHPVPLAGDAKCDYLIVGAGLTGLSIAYHLLKVSHGQVRVIVIDANTFGFGASGRSSGMIGPGIGLQFHRLVAKYGARTAQEMFSETQSAVRYAMEEIEGADFQCDFSRGVQLKVAKDRYSASRLSEERASLLRAGFSVPAYQGSELSDRVGTSAYAYGFSYDEAATVNPMKLIQSLTSKILRMGGEVKCETEGSFGNLRELSRSRTLMTDRGAVQFNKIVIATNGFSGGQGVQAGRVIPISTALVMSDRLDDMQLASLGIAENTGVIEASRLFNYFRVTSDCRVLFGGGKPCYSVQSAGSGARRWQPPRRVYDELLQDFRLLFPSAYNLSFPNRWSGTIGATLDNLPVVDVTDEPISLAIGWCGHGLAMAFLNGKRYAERVIHRREATMPWVRRRAPYLAPSALLPCATNSYVSFLAAIDGIEQNFGGQS